MSGKLSSVPRSNERYIARRRRRRRRVLIAFIALLLLLSVGIAYGLRQNAVRISHVQVFGADQSLAELATRAMQGDYLGIIPRDSAFFFPAERIRAGIAAAHPDIAAVSIFLNGLTGLSIKANARVPIARWCGVSGDTGTSSDCYFFDANGFVYATTSVDATGSPQAVPPVNSFIVYESPASAGKAIGSTLPNADKLPGAFDFARELGTFGSSVTRVIIRGDEVDDYLGSGTRVTYVLGNEQNAFTALVSLREHLNVADGSIEYADLRFTGATYVKRKK